MLLKFKTEMNSYVLEYKIHGLSETFHEITEALYEFWIGRRK